MNKFLQKYFTIFGGGDNLFKCPCIKVSYLCKRPCRFSKYCEIFAKSIARFTVYSPLEVFDHVAVALLVALQEGVAGAGVQGRQAG